MATLELAAEWWLWTAELPTRADLRELGEHHYYARCVAVLLDALPAMSDTATLGAVADLAGAVVRAPDEQNVVDALNRSCDPTLGARAWRSRLRTPYSI